MADATPVGAGRSVVPARAAPRAAGRPGRAPASAKLAPPPEAGKPLLAEEYPAAREQPKNACIHCHQVNEFRRAQRQAAGVWKREEIWVYPLPENVGLVLEVDRGDHVRRVVPGSAAAKIGVRTGDVVRSVNGVPVASQADFRYGLHRAPWKGKVPLVWSRAGRELTGTARTGRGLEEDQPHLAAVAAGHSAVADRVRRRPHGRPRRRPWGCPPNGWPSARTRRFTAWPKPPASARETSSSAIDGKVLEMTMKEFLGHVRRQLSRSETGSPWR